MMFGLTLSGDIIFSGFIQGLVYALVAFGLVLIFRATPVIIDTGGEWILLIVDHGFRTISAFWPGTISSNSVKVCRTSSAPMRVDLQANASATSRSEEVVLVVAP